jgi:hypothetical protein
MAQELHRAFAVHHKVPPAAPLRRRVVRSDRPPVA